MNIRPEIVITMDHAEYASLVLLIDYIVNEDANMTQAMFAQAITRLDSQASTKERTILMLR